MIIVLRGNVKFLSGNGCVYEFFDRLVRKENSLPWMFLR